MQAMNSHFLQILLCDLTDYILSIRTERVRRTFSDGNPKARLRVK